jgi:hypothetical protein
MKRVLLDENIHQAAFRLFPEFETKTVGFMQWNGISNGKLLALADGQFDVLITADKNIPYQQSLSGRKIAVLVINSGRLDYIEAHLANIINAIKSLRSGTFHVIISKL